MQQPPKFSIITVCFNSAATIEPTLRSVEAQTWPGIEHVLIDGGSTDATLDIVRRNKGRISTVISELDKGIYDAMNKGIAKAHGDIIYFLNSDDELCDPGVVEDFAVRFAQQPEVGLMYGNVYYRDAKTARHVKFDKITRRNLVYSHLCHQAVFARRQLFETIGLFDQSYPINADYDWFLRVFRSRVATLYVDRDVAMFTAGGRHSVDIQKLQMERRRVRLQYMHPVRFALGNAIYRAGNKVRRFLGETL